MELASVLNTLRSSRVTRFEEQEGRVEGFFVTRKKVWPKILEIIIYICCLRERGGESGAMRLIIMTSKGIAAAVEEYDS